MQDNRFHVSTSNPSETLSAPRGAAVPAFIALGVSVAVLAVLFVVNPYALGYGSHLVSIFEFANSLWKADNADWQHCYIVPFAIGAMVYFKRNELHVSEIRPAQTGLWITVFGMFVYVLGFRADNVYLGYASFQILTGGLLLWFCGWKWFSKLIYAWAFLVFLYPVPFLDAVAFPLRMLMSQASVTVLNVIGVDAVKVGTAILSAPDQMAGLKTGDRFSVDVADPCSGIRSLFALMMVSALYGYFTQPGVWRKIVIFLLSAPLAVMGNLARILMLTIGTIIMGPERAIGSLEDPSFFHMLAGYLVFIVALGGLLGVGSLLNLDWPSVISRIRSSMKPSGPAGAPATQPPGAHDEY